MWYLYFFIWSIDRLGQISGRKNEKPKLEVEVCPPKKEHDKDEEKDKKEEEEGRRSRRGRMRERMKNNKSKKRMRCKRKYICQPSKALILLRCFTLYFSLEFQCKSLLRHFRMENRTKFMFLHQEKNWSTNLSWFSLRDYAINLMWPHSLSSTY